MKCKNCGAHYQTEELKCPYCGTENMTGQEWKEELEEAQEALDREKYTIKEKTKGYRTNKILNIVLIVIAIIFTSCCLLIGILESVKHKSDDRYYSANEAKKVLEELYIKEDYQRIKAIVYYNDFFWTDGYEKYAEIASLQNDYELYMLAKVNFWQEKEWIMKDGGDYDEYLLDSIFYHAFTICDEEDLKYKKSILFKEKMIQDAYSFLNSNMYMTKEEIDTMMAADYFSSVDVDKHISQYLDRENFDGQTK